MSVKDKITKRTAPKLRFPEFMGSWRDTPISDEFNFIKTNSLSRETLTYNKKEIANIHYGDIHTKFQPQFDITKENVPYISREDDYPTNLDSQFCQEGDVVIADASEDYNDIGKSIELVNLNNSKVVSGLHTLLMRPKFQDKISLGFPGYLLRSSRVHREIMRRAVGVSVLGISKTELAKIVLNLPDSKEQQKIASFLMAVDNWIDNLKKQRSALEKYKKGMMQKIFSQEIHFMDEGGKDFPEWEEKRLGELGKFVSGQGFSDNEQGGKSGVPFYKVSDMNKEGNKETMASANHYVTNEQIKRLAYKVIAEQSIIFAKVGAAIFLERKRLAQNYILDNNMMAFIPKSGVAFFKHLFSAIRLSKYAQVGALPSYNSSDLSIIKVLIPKSEDEQCKITNFFTSINEIIESKQKNIAQAEQWKRGIMQKLFV